MMMALTWLSAILVGAGCLALGYYIGVRHPAHFLISAKLARSTGPNNGNKKNRLQEPLEIEKLADILEDFKMVPFPFHCLHLDSVAAISFEIIRKKQVLEK